MPDINITGLTNYADPKSTDVLPVVDVTADVTKKVTVDKILKNATPGTAADPGITFDGRATNTGIYSPAEYQIGLATNGVSRLFIDLNGNVGLSNTSPTNRLDVAGNINISTGSSYRINGTEVLSATALGSAVQISSANIPNGTIIDSDISATAEIAVSKLADGAARQLLQTDAAGTGVEWADNIDIPGTLDVTGAATFDSSVTVAGNLTVNGTTTTINSTTLTVDDKNIELASIASPTDVLADGGGITLKGTTDKTILWSNSTASWQFNQPVISTGASTATAFIPTGSTVPTNGIYLQSANQVGISTNSVGRLIIDSNGRVGINTTSATAYSMDLAVVGTVGLIPSTQNTVGSTVYIKSQLGSAGGEDFIKNEITGFVNSGNYGTAISFSTRTTTASTERLRITSAGSVGIGTSAPSAFTHILPTLGSPTSGSIFLVGEKPGFGNSTETSYGHVNFGNLNTSGNPSVVSISSKQVTPNFYTASSGNIAELRFTGTGTDGSTAAQAASIIASTVSSNFGNNNTELANLDFTVRGTGATDRSTSPIRMRITGDGFVGIGTNSPSYRCHVRDDSSNTQLMLTNASGGASATTGLLLSNDLYTGASITYNMSTHAAEPNFLVLANAQTGIGFNTGAARRMTIDSTGRLLVGTTAALSGGFNDNGTNSQSSNPRLQVTGTDWSQASATFATYQNAAGVFSQISFNKSRGATVGTIGAALSSGDAIGGFQFAGSDSAKFLSCAAIEAYADSGFALNSAAGRIVFKTNGGTANLTERMRIDSSGRVGIGAAPLYPLHVERNQEDLFALVNTSVATYRFQVKTDASFALVQNSTERLRMDSSGRVLVGVSASRSTAFGQALLQVENSSGLFSITRNAVDQFGGSVVLAKARGTSFEAVTANDNLGIYSFQGADGVQMREAARIQADVDGAVTGGGAADMPGRLVFSTTADGAAAPTERMRITSTGAVGIGTAAPEADFEVAATGTFSRSIILDATTGSDNTITAKATGASTSLNTNLVLQADGSSVNGTILFKRGINRSYTESARIDANGNLLVGVNTATANGGVLQVSNGITFPGTQSACSDPNTLDDYEEGTFTPTLVGQTTPGTGTYTNQTGRYTKIGNRVFIHVYLSWTAHTGTGNMRVTGLPFTSVSGTNFDTVLASLVSDLTLSANAVLQVYVVNGSSDILFNQVVPNGGTTGSVTMDTSGLVVFSGHYFV